MSNGICPTCGANGYVPEDKPRQDANAFSVPVTEEMKGTAFLLGKNERCKEDWQKFLRDLQGRSYITEKQRKFYAVIHKECFGSWPPAPGETAPKVERVPESDEMPF